MARSSETPEDMPGVRGEDGRGRTAEALRLTLPVAPSSNNAWANRKIGRGFGRIKTRAHKEWIIQADRWMVYQKLTPRIHAITVPYQCTMVFPSNLRSDLDGRSKVILDWLVSRQLTIDDKHLRKLILEHDDTLVGSSEAGTALVQIEVIPWGLSR